MQIRSVHGPAFPVADLSKTQCPGMTLRDWFAGQALSLIGAWHPGGGATPNQDAARTAYAIADAMLAVRLLPDEANQHDR